MALKTHQVAVTVALALLFMHGAWGMKMNDKIARKEWQMIEDWCATPRNLTIYSTDDCAKDEVACSREIVDLYRKDPNFSRDLKEQNLTEYVGVWKNTSLESANPYKTCVQEKITIAGYGTTTVAPDEPATSTERTTTDSDNPEAATVNSTEIPTLVKIEEAGSGIWLWVGPTLAIAILVLILVVVFLFIRCTKGAGYLPQTDKVLSNGANGNGGSESKSANGTSEGV